MHQAQAPGGGLHVIDQPGTEPPFLLLHGFPRRLTHLRTVPGDGRDSSLTDPGRGD